MTPDMEEAAKLIKEGMEKNSQDSPQLSIDPDTQKMAVVGDPNQVQPTNGDYKLTFVYGASEVSEDDKAQMKYREDSDEYEFTVEYKGKRVKPLYRQKIDLILADVFDHMGVLDQDGYTTDVNRENTTMALLGDTDKLGEVAGIVCGLTEDQVGHLDAFGLAEFLNQLLVNEPNILKESVAFLSRRLLQRQENETLKEKKKPDTQQS